MKTNIETKLILSILIDIRESKKLLIELIETRKKISNGKDFIMIDNLIKSLDSSLDERQLY